MTSPGVFAVASLAISKAVAVRHTIVAVIIVAIAAVYLVFLVGGRLQSFVEQTRQRRALSADGTIYVKPGEDLQEAINNAKFGDIIILEAGGVYQGPFLLPKKPAVGEKTDYITIRTSNLSGISEEGQRIKPELHAKAMPKILAPDGSVAIDTQAGAHHYKFIGIEFSTAANARYIYNLINLGSHDYKSYEQFPHHLIFDRCYVHSPGLNRARRGFALNSGLTSVCNSHISGFAGVGDETQGIAGWNGPGPFNILNNYIEGGGQGLMFGGGDPSITDLVPSDIKIKGNTFFKPASWFGKATIKASIELKNARRTVIDGNLIDSEGYVGAFVLTVRNQDGRAPWSTIEDLEITNNVVRGAGAGFTILGRDDNNKSQEARRIRIANNLMTGIGPDQAALFLKINGGESITLENNTIEHPGNMITSYGDQTRRFIFRNNIIKHNSYGIFCEGGPKPFSCFPGSVFVGNVIVDNENLGAKGYSISQNYPTQNFFPLGFDRVGFVDYSTGNWRLGPKSPFKGKGSNGSDPGVNFVDLEKAHAGKWSCGD